MPQKNQMIEIEQPPLRELAFLVRLALPSDSDTEIEDSMEEMRQLAATAGAQVVCSAIQRRAVLCPGTLIGSGKVEEIKAACGEFDADVVLFDSDLSPKQGSKLEKLLERKVVDRTQLILDIFAQRAQTSEGKRQVELALLQYLLPRLAGRGSVMRQQGGIGVRGPGEQKLEVDRRVIRDRIRRFEKEIESVRNTRRIQRKTRVENSVGTVALVGYTNAGKSSLLNALTGSAVFVEDKLFATLDPRSRRCTLPGRREVVLTDTVGFIRKLPHTLVAAFRATLEEVVEADLLLLVADAAHPALEEHLDAVMEVLGELGATEKAMLTVYNKSDAAGAGPMRALLAQRPNAVAVSARTGDGLDGLLAAIDSALADKRKRVRLRIPQSEAGTAARVHRNGRVFAETYEGDSIVMDAEIDSALEGQLARFVT